MSEWQKKERMFQIEEKKEKGRRSMLFVRIYCGISLLDEFVADDIIEKDDYYLILKDSKNFSLVPKTYYVRVIEKDFDV